MAEMTFDQLMRALMGGYSKEETPRGKVVRGLTEAYQIPGVDDPLLLDDRNKAEWERLFTRAYVPFKCGEWELHQCRGCGNHMALYQVNPVSGNKVARAYASITRKTPRDLLIYSMAEKYVFDSVAFTSLMLYNTLEVAQGLTKELRGLYDEALAGQLAKVAGRMDSTSATAELISSMLNYTAIRNNTTSWMYRAVEEGRLDIDKMIRPEDPNPDPEPSPTPEANGDEVA